MTAQSIERLNDIGFLFDRKVKPRTWEQRFQELTRFKESFGHCKVPRLFNQPSYEGLGKWVADQRMKHNYMERGKKSNMTQERAKRLTDLGMVWAIFKLPPKEERAERNAQGLAEREQRGGEKKGKADEQKAAEAAVLEQKRQDELAEKAVLEKKRKAKEKAENLKKAKAEMARRIAYMEKYGS